MPYVSRRLSLVVASLGFSFALSSARAAEELPLRKAGLWELTTVMDEGAGPREQTFKICIGGDMERRTAEASTAEHKENCSRYEIERTGGSTTIEAECLYSQANVRSRTGMSGDFQTAFLIEIESTTTRAGANNQSQSVKRTITQNGRYLGEACGDLQPGEAMGADGAKTPVQ